ncbi:hypothetical protein LTR99_006245 [Exophiala xenobiotica]|uniref:FAS1 domain-containing protein n=1 Tax=Vermiconidia calcicola TaxID=1690605 RepID=A0AAV9QBZ8_9PEZI|nr:hypothetical protein LTR14_009124 [Exophiala xenobiotica]KAK5534203.1 hypothetical protein LTR23_008875 [Chaetothyriales sp. CCFEE 6169]KAK5537416.1 hypothetical protein LTR25_004667 [Vermiconidia calcicola]KAK5301279.1 hypothetical protein LTR99_006245 [Exophiala xenobiotica]KAK5430626.1 hypothetical protein LTR34_006354 [Exophiala xenobiotica]
MTAQDIYDLQAYHFVQEVRYSTDLINGTQLRTLQGKNVTITVDSDGTIYVDAAKIIDPDYLWAKGVIHLIETAMNPNDTSARPASANATATAPPSSSSASGLSTSAQVGIGVGVSVGGSAFVVAVLVVRRRRRRKSRQTRRVDVVHQLDSREKCGGPKELEGKAMYPELPGQEDDPNPHEMDSTEPSTTVHELD